MPDREAMVLSLSLYLWGRAARRELERKRAGTSVSKLNPLLLGYAHPDSGGDPSSRRKTLDAQTRCFIRPLKRVLRTLSISQLRHLHRRQEEIGDQFHEWLVSATPGERPNISALLGV